jgi:hypothetical protein
MMMDFEAYQPKPAVDLLHILSCFQTISDLGATCSIELFTDIPVDGKPDIFFNWDAGSPGHTFIQLKKANLGRSMTINIGLYPVDSWKTIFNTNNIPGKFSDDTQHEYNASVKMDLTFQELSTVIATLKLYATSSKYDIDDFNCTDFAIGIFNSARPSNPLIIPKYKIPGGQTANGTSTPQSLYKELLKYYRSSSMSNAVITVPQSKTYAEPTKIPCN